MSHKEQILEYMAEGNTITPLEALHKFGCMRLGARIDDLKKEGWKDKIKGVMIKDIVTGKRYKQFSLKQLELKL